MRIAAACPAQAKLRRLVRRQHVTLQQGTVTRHSDGRWYVTLTFDRVDLHRPGPAGQRRGLSGGRLAGSTSRLPGR